MFQKVLRHYGTGNKKLFKILSSIYLWNIFNKLAGNETVNKADLTIQELFEYLKTLNNNDFEEDEEFLNDEVTDNTHVHIQF